LIEEALMRRSIPNTGFPAGKHQQIIIDRIVVQRKEM